MRAPLLAGIGMMALLAARPASAEQAGCNGLIWSVETEQTAFAAADVPSVASGTALPAIGIAAVLTLAKQDTVSFPVALSRKPKHDAPFAGVFTLPAPPAAGTYQITISDEAWIEVAQNGKLLKQVGFTGSHTCPGVHKSVRFDLGAGPATLEISDAAKDSIKLDVVPRVPE